MSEFKFACPVCGQHITADSSASGGQLSCPTCFRKIVVPQAPATTDSKFILSAAQVAKPRPASATSTSLPSPSSSPARSALPFIGIGLVLLLGAGVGVYFFRDRIFKKPPAEQARGNAPTNAPGKRKVPPVPKITYAIPTNISWTLDLANTDPPETTASGSVHGSGFLCERAVLQAVAARDAKTPARCDLSLRQGGKSGAPDLGLTLQLFAQQGEDLAGKTVEIAPDRPPPVPKVSLRWKDDQDKTVNKTFSDGYALRVAFGDASNGRMPGKIYVSLPDEAKSFIAGTFSAEIKKAAPPKPKQPPKAPKTAK